MQWAEKEELGLWDANGVDLYTLFWLDVYDCFFPPPFHDACMLHEPILGLSEGKMRT